MTNCLKHVSSFLLTVFCIFIICCKNNKKSNDNSSINLIDSDYNNGQKIFNQYCNTCHYQPEKKLTDQYMFDGLFNRLPKPSEDYFIKFIDNSKDLKNIRDKYALALDKEWNSNFEHNYKDSLTIDEKNQLIMYIKIAARQKNVVQQGFGVMSAD